MSHTRQWPHSGPHCPECICLVTLKPQDLPVREQSAQAQAQVERGTRLCPALRRARSSAASYGARLGTWG